MVTPAHFAESSCRLLSDYEALQPRLGALLKAHQEDIKLAASLEKRIAGLVERHATHVRVYWLFIYRVWPE